MKTTTMRYGERQRRRSFSPLAVGILMLGLGGVVFAGFAVAGKLPWQRHTISPPEPGMVRVWIAARQIPEFATVTPQYLYNPVIGMAAFQDVPESRASKQWLVGQKGAAEIIDRILAKSKQAGQPFTESDFLPKGTLPGIVAAIPPNSRALTLEAGKLKGVDMLQAGDHLDLLASVPIDQLLSVFGHNQSRGTAALLTNTKSSNAAPHLTETLMIAHDAMVVSPLTTRNRPIASSSLMGGNTVHSVPVQEVVLAIDRQDVQLVTEARSAGLEMDCVARSGRPNSNDSFIAPPGMKLVPVAARFVPAYSELVHDDLYDLHTRDLRYVMLTEDDVNSQGIVDSAAELLGRVVTRDRMTDQFFRKSDLLPPGTLPGLAAGVPPGDRAFAIPADKLEGSEGLRHGDHLDVMVSIPVTLEKPFQGRAAWLSTGGVDGSSLHVADVRVAVHDAVVVEPVDAPKLDPILTALLANKDSSNKSDHTEHQVVLAVAANEVAGLAEAVSQGLKLTAATRSGVRADAAAPATQRTGSDKPITDFRPLAHVGTIETMNGSKRQTILYAGSSAGGITSPTDGAWSPSSASGTP
jgi:Flp pilus assembly protein CpaB